MRKKKIITVTFKDGIQHLPSSVKVKCNITGNEKGFYTPYLVELIKRKYKNNYKYFIENYISKVIKERFTARFPDNDIYNEHYIQ